MGNNTSYRMSANDQKALWDLWHSGLSYAQIWCMSGIEEGGAFLLKLGLTKT